MSRPKNRQERDDVRRSDWLEIATIMHRPGQPDISNARLPERVEVAGTAVRRGRKGQPDAATVRLPPRTIVLGREDS